MSDARSLLRAKKSARVEHAYAAYTPAGQLRCTICAVPVKQFDTHLLTKQHRQSLAREKAQAAKTKKRAADDPAAGAAKRAKVAEAQAIAAQSGVLPPGFFSAGNAPSVASAAEAGVETGAEAGAGAGAGAEAGAEAGGEAGGETGGEAEGADAELDAFLASLNDDDDTNPTSTSTPAAPAPGLAPSRRKHVPAYKDAGEGVASYSAAPVRLVDGEPEAEGEAEEVAETEGERRARVAREEREEIMARLEDEARAQEDADSRVAALRARMEALKKRRAAKGAGAGPGTKAKGKGKSDGGAEGEGSKARTKGGGK